MHNNQKGAASASTIFLIILLLAVTSTAVYFWHNYEKEKALNELVSSLQEPAPKITPTSIAPTTNPDKGAPTPPKVTPTPTKSPVIVYTPSGLFTETEKAEIKQKYINPFVDWNSDNKTVTVSINIEKPTPAVAGYKYKISYVNEGGSNGGFLYGSSTPLEWWLPECLNGCNFTESFRGKYPEIVAQSK